MKILVILAASLVAVVLTHGAGDSKHVDETLKRFGYTKGISTPEDRKNAIMKFQKMVGIKATGELTNETIAYINKARCGDHDDHTGNVTRRYALSNSKWKKTTLRYCIFNDPANSPKFTHMDVRRAIYDGLKAWEPYIPIKFYEIGQCEGADFFFSFGKQKHANWDVDKHKRNGDCGYGASFSGSGGVLAHAFFPVNGNLHFDDNERWTENTDEGINMRFVTIHEMGHALGLGHSSVQGAIMYPYYGGYIPKNTFKMPKDEIDAMKELYYGKKSRRNIQKRAESDLPICHAKKINAVFDFTDGYTYILADDVLYRRNADGVDKGFQKKLSDIWKDAATGLQASVFVADTKTLYLFSSKKVSYAKADGKELDELKFTTVDLKSSKKYRYSGEVSAAFGSGRKKFIYLVEGDNLLKFSTIKNKIIGAAGHYQDVLHPDPAARYPPSIDGAYVSMGSNAKEVFFFVGLSYFKGVKKNKKYFIPADYPKPFLTDYLRC